MAVPSPSTQTTSHPPTVGLHMANTAEEVGVTAS